MNRGPMTSHEPLCLPFMVPVLRDPLVLRETGGGRAATWRMLLLCAGCWELELQCVS